MRHVPGTPRGAAATGCPTGTTSSATTPGRLAATSAVLRGGPRGQLPRRQAKRIGMGPAVVLRQDLAETARPVRDGAAADLAARGPKMGNGHRERRESDLLIGPHNASPVDRARVRHAHPGRR
jgi:hypothetical protein